MYRRVAATASTVVLSLAGVAGVTVTAHAATANPVRATILGVSDILSGTPSFHLDVRVTNPLPPAGTSVIDYVRVTVPAQLTVVTGSANGWFITPRDARSIDFDAPQVPLAPGTHVDFDVEVAAATVAQDTQGALEVSTSADNGITIQDATPASPTALNTRVRILRLSTPQIQFLTSTHKATAGQGNLTVSVTAENHGSDPVTVSLAGAGDSGDTVGSTPDVVIPAGSSQPYQLPVTFGAAGTSKSLRFNATSPNGTAGKASAPYDVQAPAAFSYDGSKPLTPGFGRAGGWAGFSLLISKTGDQTFTLAPTTRLTFVKVGDPTKTFDAPLGYSVGIPAGSSDKRYGFQAITLPGDPLTGDYDGTYTPTLTVVGVDGNGAPLTVDVPVSTTFTIDSFGPVAVPSLSTPHRVGRTGGPVNESSQPYVAKNGDMLTFGGPIYTDASSQQLDPTAKVSCIIDSLQNGNRIAEQSVSCSNSGGSLSGSAMPTFAKGATGAQLRVVARDSVGHSTTATSQTIVIDNKAPQLDFALTGAGASTPQARDTNTVRVRLREPTTATFNAADFTVHDSAVTFPVKSVFFDGSDTLFGQTVVLTLADPIGRDDTPVVDYHLPSVPTPPQDAAGNIMVSSSLTSRDGIVPLLPVLDSVDGATPNPDDGRIYVSDWAPVFSISSVADGETVSVYADTDGEPGLQPTDLLLCTAQATGPSTSCAATGSGRFPADGVFQVMVQGVDPSGNVSTGPNAEKWATATVVVDTVAPTLTGFTTTPSGVVATFDEPIASGRDAARDWSVYNGPVAYVVGTVGVGDAASRVLSINSVGWTGLATRVAYVFTGSNPLDRYRDLAGNLVPDQYYDVSTGTTTY